MSNIFFTADLHFNHANILKYQPNRGCDTVEEMNELIIKNWNDRVKDNDFIYILGDMFMGQAHKVPAIITRLNGIKRLIRGNHDPDKMLAHIEPHLDWVKDYFEKSFVNPSTGKKVTIGMSHFPMSSWHRMGHSSIMLHGHTHGSLTDPNAWIFNEDHIIRQKVEGLNKVARQLGLPPYMVPLKRMDVGLDCTDMAPISLEEVFDRMDKVNFVSVDHHDAGGNNT